MTCGVSWVDDDHDSRLTLLPGLVERLSNVMHIQTPALFLIQSVVHLNMTEQNNTILLLLLLLAPTRTRAKLELGYASIITLTREPTAHHI